MGKHKQLEVKADAQLVLTRLIALAGYKNVHQFEKETGVQCRHLVKPNIATIVTMYKALKDKLFTSEHIVLEDLQYCFFEKFVEIFYDIRR